MGNNESVQHRAPQRAVTHPLALQHVRRTSCNAACFSCFCNVRNSVYIVYVICLPAFQPVPATSATVATRHANGTRCSNLICASRARIYYSIYSAIIGHIVVILRASSSMYCMRMHAIKSDTQRPPLALIYSYNRAAITHVPSSLHCLSNLRLDAGP